MPIYMDLHIAPGVTATQVAEAHIRDVKIQEHYCCKAMTYWLDEDKGFVFCLIEAPDKDAVVKLHETAHGLIPHEIIQVDTEVVKAFLGRIKHPESAVEQPENHLKIFSDPAFRTILVIEAMDTRLLQHRLGKERTQELLLLYSTILRDEAKNNNGFEVYLKEAGYIISFVSAPKAVECALSIKKRLSTTANMMGLRFGIHAGVPVGKSEAIFGATIRFAKYLCAISKSNQVTMSFVVGNLCKENDLNILSSLNDIRYLTCVEENFLETLRTTLEENWQNPEFGVTDFCKVMSISKPQLYRKCVSATGMSPNTLLREYRLICSLDLLRNEDRNISQTTFDTGFSSPSYFTKCFQKRFGIQPLAYLKSKV